MDGPYGAKVSKVNQTSIPREICNKLGIGTGSHVHYIIPDFLDGVAILVPDETMKSWLSVGLEVALARNALGTPDPQARELLSREDEERK